MALVTTPIILWGAYYTFRPGGINFYTELRADDLVIHTTLSTRIEYSQIQSVELGEWGPTRKAFEELSERWGRLFGGGDMSWIESTVVIRTNRRFWSWVVFIPTYVRVRKVIVENREDFVADLRQRIDAEAA